ncbi:MAG: hypothetical protein QW279_09610 [Candidatus Jordarchaeaceae archaeon]
MLLRTYFLGPFLKLRRYNTSLLSLICLIFFLSLLVTSLAWGYDNKLQSQYSEGRAKADEVYKSFYNTINEPNKLADYWMNPLVGKGTLKTVNGTAVGGNTTLLCASGKNGREVLKLDVIPMGSGDLQVYVTWEVVEGQKKVMNFDMVSAPCANGVIICTHPTAFANCNYYVIDYNASTDSFYLSNTTKISVPAPGGNGTVEREVPVSYKTLASPCVCVKNVCGSGTRNSFAANPGYILQLLGGAFVSALQAKRPDFILTNADIEGYTIRYYGQNQKECNGVESSSYVRELTSYKDNTAALEMKGSEMYYSLRTATNSTVHSVYTLYEAVKDNMTNFDLYSCTKRHVVIPQTYSISDMKATESGPCGTYDVFFTAVNEKTIQLKLNAKQMGVTSFTFDLFPDLLSYLGKVEVRLCTVAKARGPCFDDDVCVAVNINGYTVTACGKNKDRLQDHVREIPVSVLKTNNTGSVHVYYAGDGGVPNWCPPLIINFYFKEEPNFCFVKSEYEDNGCKSYEEDPRCVLYDEFYTPIGTSEKVPLAVGGMRTGYTPLESCMQVCPSLEICRNDWLFERRYKCKRDGADFTELVKRQEHIKSTLGISGNTEITFEDLRKMQNEWKVFSNNKLILPFGNETDDCMYVCKVSKQHTLREVEQDMSKRGFDRPKEKEFTFRMCVKNEQGQYTCPVKEGERMEIDCRCDSTFNEAIIALQALRQAAMDLMCTDKK